MYIFVFNPSFLCYQKYDLVPVAVQGALDLLCYVQSPLFLFGTFFCWLKMKIAPSLLRFDCFHVSQLACKSVVASVRSNYVQIQRICYEINLCCSTHFVKTKKFILCPFHHETPGRPKFSFQVTVFGLSMVQRASMRVQQFESSLILEQDQMGAPQLPEKIRAK